MITEAAPRILLIRRDNIGDLALTTPLISALRQRFPHAYLCALVTRYTRAVLDHHPALDRVVAYTKAKHLGPGESVLGCYWERFRLLWELRQQRFDYCLLAAPGYQKRVLPMARWIGAKHVVGFIEADKLHSSLIDRPVPWQFNAEQSESEDVWGLAAAFDIDGPPPASTIYPDPHLCNELAPAVAALRQQGTRLVGIHISARKPSQRWDGDNFVQLLHRLHTQHSCRFLLFWSPGPANDPRHPGDDEKATAVLQRLEKIPVLPMPTHGLDQLIAAISLCDDFICADGGAMHLAAALGKPIVCLFGHSSATRWRPWGVPYRLLQTGAMQVSEISVDEVTAAYTDLCYETLT